MPTKLDYFLDGRSDGKSDRDRNGRKVTVKDAPFTLWSFENKHKWFVDEDDLDEFYKLYCADIRCCVPRFLTERSTPIGQLRVDLDFKYEGRVEEHKHTRDQVIAFAKAYMEEVRKYITVSESEEIYILEKEYPTFDPIKKVSNSGIHMQVPSLKSRADVEQGVRRGLLNRMEEFFPNLGCTKGWDDIYDKAPLTHSGNWPLLGSKKPAEGSLPYEVKYALDWEAETGEITVDENVTSTPTIDLVRRLSVRSRASDETPLTEYGVANTRAPAEPRSVSRGRRNSRQEPGERAGSPTRNREPLGDTRRENLEAHVMNLGTWRSIDRAEWIKVGIVLKNIHPTDLYDVWHRFSSRYPEYKEPDTHERWQGFNDRVSGERAGEGSLRFWSRTDNYDGYMKIESMNVDKLVDDAAMGGTEFDVARVIYARYRDEFVCASVRNNDWYQYVGHIWQSSENGVDLLARFSAEIAKLFRDKEIAELNNITINGECPHKEPLPDCPTCVAEKRAKAFSNARTRLKTTSFKSNVMKECTVLFRDREFATKLDENKKLIAFSNGVFDTSLLEFRDGKPDDYISFCTNVDYAVDKAYHQYKCWSELDKFLRSILPHETVRMYFLNTLSTCLSGEFVQRFHILTGSGSNGKSMLMNLMATGMGDYCYKANIAMFTQKRGKSGAAAPEMIRMKGRRFVTMSEPDEGEPLSTGFLKELTGSEKISARDLYAGSKQMVEFDVMCKFFLSCNEKPPIKTTDGGTWRRIKVIDFPSKFVHEPTLPHELPIDESIMHKVLSEDWAACFMAYMVHLYKLGKGHHKMTPPKEVNTYTEEYQEESDVIARFIREHCNAVNLTEGVDPVIWSSVTNTFQEWKRSNEVMGRGNVQDLKKRIESQYGKYPRSGWISFRFGSS
jgi:P4 family phage/plasmid primase-like protien